MKRYRCVGNNGGEFLTHDGTFFSIHDFLPHCSFYLFGVCENVFYRFIFCQQFSSGLFAHTRNARNIVHRIAHQGQHIYDLTYRLDTPTLTHFFGSKNFGSVALIGWFVNENIVAHYLTKIFIGRDHINCIAQVGSF